MQIIQTLSAFTALLLLTCQCSAQPPPPTAAPPAESQEYLEAHNRARSEVGVAPLRWSPALAKTASLKASLQRDKKNCSFANLRRSRYGSNQLWASGNSKAPHAVVEAWVAEKKFYNNGKNTCEGEAEQRCEPYTQVVWRNSAEVGCAQVACLNMQASLKIQASLTLCFYDPPGNVVGEKPY